MDGNPANPYLVREAGTLVPGSALDAGRGAWAEAIWLAGQGWRVTAVDLAAAALARAARRAASGNLIQVPVLVPVNVCGNTVNVIALLNPSFGNTCVNS